MRRDAQRRRAAADREAQHAHENVLAVHRERVAQARAARDEARAAHRWTAWLRGAFAVRRAQRQVPAVRLPASQPTAEEERWAAGSAGELLIADRLGLALDDEWILLHGYSPSVQLNEPASQLEGFLVSRGHPVAIGRIVVLIHPRAQLRSCTRPTVHIFTSVRQILNLLNASAVAITTAENGELERLIVRDHRFHDRRRSP